MPSTTTQDSAYDEIDLRELLLTLWRAKLLILIVVLAATALAVAYLAFATPTYQTQAIANDISSADLGRYNSVRRALQISQAASATGTADESTVTSAVTPLQPGNTYAIFVSLLPYAGLRQVFFDKFYLPGHPDIKSQTERVQLRAALDKRLTIKKSGPQGPVTITLEGADPQKIATWLNQYINIVRTYAQEQVATILKTEILKRIREIDDQIDDSRIIAAKEREYEISRLEEALKLADKLQIVKPEVGAATSYANSEAFLLGSEALRAKIALLEQQTDDDPYIQQLPKLLYAKRLLAAAHIDPKPFPVVTIIQPATPPKSPIRPRENLIIAAAPLIGLMIGVLIALTRWKMARFP